MGGHGIVAPHPARRRPRVRDSLPGRRPACICLLRRGGGQHRRLPRDAEHGFRLQLPVIFLCENNRYGMGTAFERVAAVTDVVEHACSYDMAASW